MSRIGERFAELRRLNRVALVPYITAGYPKADQTPEILLALAAAGADILEVGVPFSDPLADGVTIQRSSQQALTAGITPTRCFEFVAAARARGLDRPVVLMGYVNPILRYGVAAYLAAAARAGVDGLIVPDLPVEEADEIRTACRQHEIDLIFLVAPTSPDDRIRSIADRASGFLYCVSLTGVTGARPNLQTDLPAFLGRVRRQTDLPLAVGFGIGTPDQARAIGQIADGVVVGSALIDRIGQAAPDAAPEAAGEFIAAFRRALDAAPSGTGVPGKSGG